MAKFLFWNINKKDLTDQIVALCHENEVDVLILAETDQIDDLHLANRLSAGQDRRYYYLDPQFEKISFFHRYTVDRFKPLHYESQIAGIDSVPNVLLKPPLGADILIVALHVPSKLHYKPSDQEYFIRDAMDEIRFYERNSPDARTVVVGDFNMNPFEDGLTAADCFHAVMDKRTALKGSREVRNTNWLYFYNPMWRLMGNALQGPPGTFYHSSSKVVSQFWHTLDQVLIRPPLIKYFNEDSLRIIHAVKGNSLLRPSGKPDSNNFSDHLPLFFEIEIENIKEETENGQEESMGASRGYS